MGNPWDYDLSALKSRSPLLIVVGSDSDPSPTERGGYKIAGTSDLYRLLPESFVFDQLNLCKRFQKAAGRPDPTRYECVLNLVTDPDQHPQTLSSLQKLLRGHRGRVINRPEAVLKTTRDQVAKRLAAVPNLRVPGTVRLKIRRPDEAQQLVDKARVTFPAILRRAGTHAGQIVGKIDQARQAAGLLAEPGEYIMTEFVDFRSTDGLYRKYRVFFIGERRIFRHLIGADSWNIHAKERFAFMAHHPGLIAEERGLLESPDGKFGPEVAATLDAVRQHMGLDFFGMDFGIGADGQIVLFEANATMNFFPVRNEPPFEHIRKVIPPSILAFRELLGAAAQRRAG